MKKCQTDMESHQAMVDKLEDINRRAQDALIFSNPLTDITIESLRGKFDALSGRINNQVNHLENQILSRDATNLTDEQLKEYKDSFAHFDKNKNGRLDRLEFRGVLLSLGFPIPQVD
jgi:hypothetical protein